MAYCHYTPHIRTHIHENKAGYISFIQIRTPGGEANACVESCALRFGSAFPLTASPRLHRQEKKTSSPAAVYNSSSGHPLNSDGVSPASANTTNANNKTRMRTTNRCLHLKRENHVTKWQGCRQPATLCERRMP